MSLCSDLKEVLTPYAQRIKGLTAADEEIKADIADVTFPLELVATYENKILRKTGMVDYTGWTVYQYKIPDRCGKVHIKTNFYGNVFIIFTDMGADGNFSSNPYTQFPPSGYSTATTVDQDLNTNKFHYVWIPLYNASGVTVSATASLIDIVNDIYDNTIIASNTNNNISDFNNAERNHIYVITSGQSSILNYPPIPNGGTLLCFATFTIDNVQIFISSQSAIFFRRMWGSGSWSAWKQIITTDNVQSVVNSAVTESLDGYYLYNILSAFKNITCIGDSLTYSQVYTGASASRQAYNPYPTVLAKRCGATETILATAGDTASQAWDRNGGNIVQKDAQLTIIYLGTNGGLTDTIDTDCVGDDYTQWSNTNTGCYAKLIAKSISVGSRVVLLKIHTNSNLTTTNNVIVKMGAKFGVPVIENTYLSGIKYHSYPDGSGTNGTHYNDFGYAVFADQIANSISQLSAEDAVKIIPI